MIEVKDSREFKKIENMEVGETFIYYGCPFIATELNIFRIREGFAQCLNLTNGKIEEFNFDQKVRIVDFELTIKGDK